MFIYKNRAPKTNRFDPLTLNEQSNESVEGEPGSRSFIFDTQPPVSCGQNDHLEEILNCEVDATR